ncbi:DUF4239 domain-containing protein [Corallococcus praedator]|uniref:DUF4239 domain-containing protein n=1 Tax=Corallococcus praedator TaxID=2316724 RepID=A0ABX9QNY9_9BACT|nr:MULTISPECIES: DUF4239 domain-containing protein [Corallococcus]RKH18069.1 DUF4239 domain-containing protein [Corallococcus sp. CA047B]RKH34199.1 DUF4239 domain-containing protein [Corallococcus sp. CA031C]RKI12951.1 DUF4239 domain-containing protein [Corallococcus praedator]
MRIVEMMPTWGLALGVLALLYLSLEAGYWLSHRKSGMDDVSALQASVLGLVALLLAFSFSMASDRYTLRRDLVVKEANAIGTFYLRTDFFPEPTRGEMRTRLRRYTDIRLEGYEAAGNPELFEQLLQESNALQDELWSLLKGVAPQTPTAVLTLSTEALNDLIDVSGERLASARNIIPNTIFALLLVGMLGSAMLLGFRPDTRNRGGIPWLIFVVILTAVMFTLVDLDVPLRGRIRSDQKPLRDLQQQLRSMP